MGARRMHKATEVCQVVTRGDKARSIPLLFVVGIQERERGVNVVKSIVIQLDMTIDTE